MFSYRYVNALTYYVHIFNNKIWFEFQNEVIENLLFTIFSCNLSLRGFCFGNVTRFLKKCFSACERFI